MFKPTESYQALMVEYRETARKFATQLSIRWSVSIDSDERGAIADLALCEAAHKYDPNSGTSFPTYLYYAIMGALKRVRVAQRLESRTSSFDSGLDAPSFEDSNGPDEIPSPTPLPDISLYRKELRSICTDVLADLSGLEREVLLQSFVREFSVTQLARQLGYSRGYLTAVKKRGMLRFQKLLLQLQNSTAEEKEFHLEDGFKKAA